jgi:hypothetical protein
MASNSDILVSFSLVDHEPVLVPKGTGSSIVFPNAKAFSQKLPCVSTHTFPLSSVSDEVRALISEAFKSGHEYHEYSVVGDASLASFVERIRERERGARAKGTVSSGDRSNVTNSDNRAFPMISPDDQDFLKDLIRGEADAQTVSAMHKVREVVDRSGFRPDFTGKTFSNYFWKFQFHSHTISFI